MFDFLRRDPISKAKKHVEKGLTEVEEDYPDYASEEFEKAAEFFFEGGRSDMAIKYFREAAYYALVHDDHVRSARLKSRAAEILLMDAKFKEAGSMYAESSDHLFRGKKNKESVRTLSLSVLCNLAARNFDTAVNLSKKTEKRAAAGSVQSEPMYELARICVGVLVEGFDVELKSLKDAVSSVKTKQAEKALIDFLTTSVRYAMETEVVIEWAGKDRENVNAKQPIEFELRYNSPIHVRPVDFRFTLSNSVTFVKEPEIKPKLATEESWLLVVKPVLSGAGTVGPFYLTLEGSEMLVYKHSNQIDFEIARAPADLEMELTPQRISCDIGDEIVFDVSLTNRGEGAAENVCVNIELSDGLEISLGGDEKNIQFIGSGEKMLFQVYVRGTDFGDQMVVIRVNCTESEEITKAAQVAVG
jgi:uncharacterized repeat protein (TIGR01451 family)